MFKVRFEPCDQCLFSDDKIVSDGRRAEVLRQCAREDRHFQCHKATIEGKDVCCREFFDRMGHTVNMTRICSRMGWVQFTDDQGNPVQEAKNV